MENAAAGGGDGSRRPGPWVRRWMARWRDRWRQRILDAVRGQLPSPRVSARREPIALTAGGAPRPGDQRPGDQRPGDQRPVAGPDDVAEDHGERDGGAELAMLREALAERSETATRLAAVVETQRATIERLTTALGEVLDRYAGLAALLAGARSAPEPQPQAGAEAGPERPVTGPAADAAEAGPEWPVTGPEADVAEPGPERPVTEIRPEAARQEPAPREPDRSPAEAASGPAEADDGQVAPGRVGVLGERPAHRHPCPPSAMPLISVVVVTTTWPASLDEVVGSVLAQDYPSWELVVVDDRVPRPPTPALAATDGRVRVIPGAGAGTRAAARRAAEAVTGVAVVCLADDRPLEPGWMRATAAAWTAEPAAPASQRGHVGSSPAARIR